MPFPLIPFAAMWARLEFGEGRPLGGVRPVVAGPPGEHVVVGKWFDGRRNQPVEEIVWLSPDATEAWVRDDADLKGKLTFWVRLLSLTRADPWDLDLGSGSLEDPSRAVVAVDIVAANGAISPVVADVEPMLMQRSRQAGDLLALAWLNLEPAFGAAPPTRPISTGANRMAVFRVQVPITDAVRGAVQVRVRATTPRRTRVATFQLWPRLPLSERRSHPGG